MITPMEIQEKEFTKGFKGYREDEVNEFLDQITLDLERLLEENRNLKEEKEKLEKDLEKYQGSEGAVLQTLEAAKSLMGDISVSAEKRAEILLKNAELDAQLMQREAREAVERINEENNVLKNRYNEFRGKYRKLLETELQRFDTLTAELFPDFDIEDLVDPPEQKKTVHPKPAASSGTAAATRDMAAAAKQAQPRDIKDTMVNIK